MAEPLTAELRNSEPDQASYLSFLTRHHDIDDELTHAQETARSIRRRRKDLRKAISADGHNISAFDRAMVDAKSSGEEREAEDRQYRRMMAWQRKPIGTQAGMFDEETAAGAAAADGHHLKQVDRDGFAAGRAGHAASLNSWTPGTEEFSTFLSAWTRGQQEKVEKEIGTADPPKRGRGRPRKQADAEGKAEVQSEARRLGYENGIAGNRDNAARYPSGSDGHGEYMLGFAAGEEDAAAKTGAEPAPAEGELMH